MDMMQKLQILGAGAKYDVACTSSGSSRGNAGGGSLGNTVSGGICHSFAADGRCISLLKVLFTNACMNDCAYCVNRVSNDVPRATFTPEELANLTIEFYRRNFIEGLFLSSGIIVSPDYTMELLCRCLFILRNEYRFGGYIHAKAIPGASPELIHKLGTLCDRMSVNIELPSQGSLEKLAPQKSRESILRPMGNITQALRENRHDLAVYKNAKPFAPAGQSTQMIIGATPDSDLQIIRLSEGLYKKYKLKRVFYSAYMPVSDNPNLPARTTAPPLLREHRLYQADWLMRFYGFSAGELLDENRPSFDSRIDPKCDWALRHLDIFPMEVNKADYYALLRVPGIGVRSAQRICQARRMAVLRFEDLKKLGVVLRRAVYFILCAGKAYGNLKMNDRFIYDQLIADYARKPDYKQEYKQLSLFQTQPQLPTGSDIFQCVTGEI